MDGLRTLLKSRNLQTLRKIAIQNRLQYDTERSEEDPELKIVPDEGETAFLVSLLGENTKLGTVTLQLIRRISNSPTSSNVILEEIQIPAGGKYVFTSPIARVVGTGGTIRETSIRLIQTNGDESGFSAMWYLEPSTTLTA